MRACATASCTRSLRRSFDDNTAGRQSAGAVFCRIIWTASPRVLTRSADSSSTSMPNSSSNARMMSTSRAEFTPRSSMIRVPSVAAPKAVVFFTNGLMMLMIFPNAVLVSMPVSLSSVFPPAEDEAAVHVAEAEAGLGQDARREVDGPMRDARGKRRDVGVDILAVDRPVDEAAADLQHRRHRFDSASRAQAVPDERLSGVDPGELFRPPPQRP